MVDLPSDGPATGEALSALLDLVLESLCGVPVGWRKGPQVTAADGRRLLDGTVFKPRRLLDLPDHERLAVFTTAVSRVGVGTGRRAVAQVVEYLRRAGVPFGLLTNGREWRLLWAEADALAWVEWDADRWLNAEVLSEELEVFRRVISAPALARRGRGLPSWPPSATPAAVRPKLSKELGERVRQAVEALLRARAPVVAPAWEHHAGDGSVRRGLPLRHAPGRGPVRRGARSSCPSTTRSTTRPTASGGCSTSSTATPRSGAAPRRRLAPPPRAVPAAPPGLAAPRAHRPGVRRRAVSGR
ncbi:MAG: hypothetical protein IPI35_20490 [Deltaproteobacteria bacterium]|nr:hypothetical protein [Deltaproteobacteria bacterium]